MKLHILLIIGFSAIVAGCAEKEQPAPEQGSEMAPATSAVIEAPEVEPEATSAQEEDWRNTAFLDHMHVHAEHLDDLNYALDDGDLERALIPAYWLSRHKTVSNLPAEFQPFVIGMRDAARAVEEAEDLAAARAAAAQISLECQACHAAVGIATQLQ